MHPPSTYPTGPIVTHQATGANRSPGKQSRGTAGALSRHNCGGWSDTLAAAADRARSAGKPAFGPQSAAAAAVRFFSPADPPANISPYDEGRAWGFQWADVLRQPLAPTLGRLAEGAAAAAATEWRPARRRRSAATAAPPHSHYLPPPWGIDGDAVRLGDDAPTG